MGPRSCDRGKHPAGAAPDSSFSYASMGPRSCDRGKAPTLFDGEEPFWLQWGRGHATAERRTKVARIASRRLASMGPRSCDRGKHKRVARPVFLPSSFNGAAVMRPRKGFQARFQNSPCRTLQWGRGHATAERSSPTRAGHRGCKGFNGAAVMRPRKVFPRILSLVVLSCFNGAAVMRPRKGGSQNGAQTSRSPLQWGRGHATAESQRLLAFAFWLGSFNGAAVMRPRKGICEQGQDRGRIRASMGPRSCDRGKRNRRRVRWAGSACFNGAAVMRPRKVRAGRGSSGRRRCFNGAAVMRPRKEREQRWENCHRPQ